MSFQEVFQSKGDAYFSKHWPPLSNFRPILRDAGVRLKEVKENNNNKTLWLTYNGLVVTLHLYIIQLFSEWRQLFILWLLLSLDGFRLVWRHFRYFFQPWHFHLQLRLWFLQWLDTARDSCVRVLRDRV